ncbi:MAG: 30S ribosomal protein S12 methylthiotransferase RimO [Pseudomonadota bacterium]
MSDVAKAPQPRVGFVSLGCPKALVDSERILTQLRTDGYEVVPEYDAADLVVVNTCGFIDSAKAESLETIGEALEENGRVLVTGCMGANEGDILHVHPKVLGVSGPQQYEAVVASVHEHLPPPVQLPFEPLVPRQGIKLTPRHYAYLKISEGCNHRCSFCIIPSMRGDLVSRRIDSVLAEARKLAAAGVRELLVIAQDTSAYGVDVRYAEARFAGQTWETRFEDLCKALAEIGIWVRLHYVYPYPHVDKVIPLMAAGRILPYLDVPLQHGSPEILKLMRRPAAAHNTLKRIKTWREICPELVIRSTFIVGFPGETDAHFEELLEFLEEAQLDRVGCFTYSPVDGARANALPDAVPADVAEERHARFMESAQRISRARLARRVGEETPVLIDLVDADGAMGRSYGESPEIDGVVRLPDGQQLLPGQLVPARITGADEYDLTAEALS